MPSGTSCPGLDTGAGGAGGWSVDLDGRRLPFSVGTRDLRSFSPSDGPKVVGDVWVLFLEVPTTVAVNEFFCLKTKKVLPFVSP